MVALIVLSAVAAALVVAIALFYRHSTSDAWATSETRGAFLGVILAIGPFFGVRARPARAELPAAVATMPEEPATPVVIPPPADPDEPGPEASGEPPSGTVSRQ